MDFSKIPVDWREEDLFVVRPAIGCLVYFLKNALPNRNVVFW